MRAGAGTRSPFTPARSVWSNYLMPFKRRTLWTSEDDERLKAMVASGVPILKAAAAFKCTTESIRTKARKLGTPFPSMHEARKKFASDPGLSRRFR
jgi:hypothetical protein